MIQVRRALLSVYDKTGLEAFARGLAEQGIEILSSGGTARALEAAGIAVTPVERLTGVPQLFDGRVKTLTPQIHGGLLMRRDDPRDRAEAAEHDIRPIDLLGVNLYPFADTVAAHGADRDACIEMIDVGGPAMVRAAAKNHRHVVVITDPGRYPEILELLRAHGGSIPRPRAAELAAEAFAVTGAYDAAIFRYLSGGTGLPRAWAAGGTWLQDLRYGENPSQRAACYLGAQGFWSRARQLQGKELSFNNLADLWSAWRCLGEFAREARAACVVIKHATPCGVALAEAPGQAFARARDCDPLSAFGGVVLLNRPCDADVAAQLADMFLEVVGAPAWSAAALDLLRRKKSLRVMELPPLGPAPPAPKSGPGPAEPWTFKSLGEAILVQTPLPPHHDPSGWRCVTAQGADAETLAELDFAWRVTRHVRSNAIVLTRARQAIGLGGGQTSRIDAADVAILKARRVGHALDGSVLASDAFFPFRDVVDRAAQIGVRAIVQPGGSVRDDDSIAACNEHGLAMYFTGERVFTH